MNWRMRLGLLATLVLVFSGVSLYILGAGGSRSVNADEETALDVALAFIRNGATFRFDGIAESLSVKDHTTLKSLPLQHVVTVVFDCRQSGYGDRTGQILAQVITPHSAVVKVVEDTVVSAVIDQRWDEMNQQRLDSSERGLLTIEMARDISVDYVIREYLPAQTIPVTWAAEEITPKGLVGFRTVRYVSGQLVVTIGHPVVWKPTYAVSVEFQGSSPFLWKGTVNQDGSVVENSLTKSDSP